MATAKHTALHKVLLAAFENQDTLNKGLTPAWASQGFPYYRAVWTELAEAIQHCNWLWWKASEYGKAESPAQIADIHIELCDILHFGISMDLMESQTRGEGVKDQIDYHCRQYAQWFEFQHTGILNFYHSIEQTVVTAIVNQRFDIEFFSRACASVGLTLPKLLVLYFGKSTLNKFRWDNGYKLPAGDPKKYKKMWPSLDGTPERVEDNVHLFAIVQRLMAMNTDDDILQGLSEGKLQEGIYQRLQARYEMV